MDQQTQIAADGAADVAERRRLIRHYRESGYTFDAAARDLAQEAKLCAAGRDDANRRAQEAQPYVSADRTFHAEEAESWAAKYRALVVPLARQEWGE